MIDPRSRWFCVEQCGPSLGLWSEIWQSEKENGELTGVYEQSTFMPVRRSRPLGENMSSTYGYDTLPNTEMIHQIRMCYPWISKNRHYECSIEGLNLELIDFYNYIMPTYQERSVRLILYQTIYSILKSNFSDILIDTYGSFKTDLFLPTSDIDIVVFCDWKVIPLDQFKQVLIKSGLCVFGSILILDKAAVPIIKFRSVHYDLRVDITFNTKNGTKASAYIKNALNVNPVLKQLIMILKQFLLQRDANEVYHGGISSYSLILMAIALMKKYESHSQKRKLTLAELLILFFEFYGKKFDYLKEGITFRSSDCFVDKSELIGQCSSGNGDTPSLLFIQDPLNPENDVGKSSFGVMKIKNYFESAYVNLMMAIRNDNDFIFQSSVSILGRIILIPPHVIKYRNFIKDCYFKYRSAKPTYCGPNIKFINNPLDPN
ncbi:MAG: Non-canonical poly(A) RNA polymerase papd5 [Paramarteilia canceri]